jgi:hypothetical protein
LEELEEAGNSVGGLARRLIHAGEKKIDPCFPVAGFADVLEQLVIARAVFFQVEAQVEQWLRQHAIVTEQKGDEKAADAAVAVEEGVDRLELDVSERGADERRHGLVVEKLLQCAEAVEDVVGRRRDEEGVAGARAADPVLRRAEFTGLFFAAATFGEELGVNFAQQAQRKWKPVLQAREPVIHGSDVVGDLLDVVEGDAGGGFVFEEEEFGEGGLGSFDLRGKQGLFPDVAVKKEVRVRQKAGDAAESTKGNAGPLEEGGAPGGWWGGWQRLRHEGVTGLADHADRLFVAGGTALHGKMKGVCLYMVKALVNLNAVGFTKRNAW